MGFLKKLFGGEPQPGDPQPVTDETFEPQVLASETPAVVDFWSTTCPPCQVMSGLLAELGPQFVGRVNIFKLRVDQNPEMAARYQVRSVPTLVLFRNGRPVERIVGLLPLQPLRAKLEQLAE
jgi:thioredoxin 1